MKYKSISIDFFEGNRAKICSKLKPNSLAIIVSNNEVWRSGDQNHSPYRQNSDLFYLTGIEQEKTMLVLCPHHPNEKYREFLFLIQPEKEMETWTGHKLSEEEAKAIAGVKNVHWLSKFDVIIADLMVNSNAVYLNTNENLRFESTLIHNDLRFIELLKNRFPLHKYKRLAPIITAERLRKKPTEIELMQKACEITNLTFKRLLKFVKPDVMEYEVEAEIMHEFIRNGCNWHSFHPIIASGKNACILHYPDNDKQCKDGDLLLIDFGCEYANYTSDCSRAIPVNGKFTIRQREVYEAVLRVQRAAIPLMVEGKTINQLNEEVDRIMEKELIGLGLLKVEDIQKDKPEDDRTKKAFFKYYMHGLSHFMGIDVHDVGTKDTRFQAGMVLSCEPGIYISEENIGVRIETDILITDDEPIDLLKDIPVDVDEIEKLMSK